MSVFVDCLLPGAQRPVHAEAPQGGWTTVAHARPDAVLAAIDGSGPGEVGILLDGRQIAGMTPDARVRQGLGVAVSRLDEMPVLRVLDVVGLGLAGPRAALWQTVVGSASARSRNADDEALVRALAGRMGLARWIDEPTAGVAGDVAALADAARALAGLPTALLWRRPEWLDATAQDDITTALIEEQRHAHFAVIEFTTQVG